MAFLRLMLRQIRRDDGHNHRVKCAALYPLEEITSSLGFGLWTWPWIGGQVLIESFLGGEPVTAELATLDQPIV